MLRTCTGGKHRENTSTQNIQQTHSRRRRESTHEKNEEKRKKNYQKQDSFSQSGVCLKVSVTGVLSGDVHPIDQRLCAGLAWLA